MPSVSPITNYPKNKTVSPIANYLKKNKAIPVRDKSGCHFFSPEGLYLGHLTKSTEGTHRIINLNIFGPDNKKLYSKQIVYSGKLIRAINYASPVGIVFVPIQTTINKIFVDFYNKITEITKKEISLKNQLDILAFHIETGAPLFHTPEPFSYDTDITFSRKKDIKCLSYSVQ